MKSATKKAKSADIGKLYKSKNKTDETKPTRASKVAVRNAQPRRKTNELLTQNEDEETARALLNAYDVSAFLADTSGVILTANDTFAKRTGRSMDELIGNSVYDLMPLDLSQTTREKIKKVIRTGNPVHFIDQRGGLFLENNIYPVNDEYGRVVRLAVYSRDISIRKQVEEAARTSEQRYRTLFEDGPVSIWVEDFSDVKEHLDSLKEQGVIDFRTYFETHPEALVECHAMIKVLDVNQAALKMYHAESKQALLESLDQGLSRGKVEQLTDLIAIAEGKISNNWEGADETLTGEPIEISLSWSVVPGHEADLSKVIVITTDITERKRAEEALRVSEERFRSLVEWTPEPITVHRDGIFIYFNAAANKVLGATDAQNLIGKPISDLVHPDSYPTVRERVKNIAERGESAPLAEMKFLKLDGTVIDVETQGTSIIYNGLPAVHVSWRDITKRKQAEYELRSRERYQSLLNEMTRVILLSNNFDTTLTTLAVDMAKLINADDCYITRWEEEEQLTIPTATTAILKTSYSNQTTTAKELSMTNSVLNAGHALTAEDVYNSPYISIDIAKQYPVRSILGVPLIAGGHKLGAAIIAFNTPHHFTSEEIEQAEQAGNQIALALWNFQQSSEIQHRLKESNALAEISRALSETESTGTDKVFQLIVDSARELISRAEESVIHLVEVEEQSLLARAVSGFDEAEKKARRVKMRLEEGVAGQVIREGLAINIRDVMTDPRFFMSDSPPKFRSLLVAPVQIGRQQIGTISIQSRMPNAFSREDQELLNSFGVQAAIAIENTRLFETTQQRLKEVNALYKTGQVLAASLDADVLLEDVVMLLQDNFNYYHVQIYLLDPLSGDLVLQRGSGEIGTQLLKSGFRLSKGLGIVGHVAETAIPFVTNNVNDVVFFYRNPLLPETQSELTVPISVEGNVLGVLDIQHTSPSRFTESDLQLVTAVAGQLAVALQKAKLYADLQIALQHEQTIRSQLIQSERLALVGRLLASVSHELNNPLQAIQNTLFLLKDETGVSSQGRQDLSILLAETERMKGLIDRLRSMYRPIRAEEFQAIQFNDLIKDVHALISAQMRHSEIKFQTDLDPKLPVISGISDQLQQVALNLILNAAEATPAGGSLVVKTQTFNSEIAFSVKDTGRGIAPDFLPKIFDAFVTDKSTGTGLGLTIVQDIVQRHNGRIRAENAPEGGAVFTVWLPVSIQDHR